MLGRVRGSVFPPASVIALPSALLAVFFHWLLHSGIPWADDLKEQASNLSSIWEGYTTVLGVLLIFRQAQSYGNFTLGVAATAKIRAEWFESVSWLFAYCSKEPQKKAEVEYFQYSLVRLASALHCFSTQQLMEEYDENLEIVKFDGLDEASRSILDKTHDRCELTLQWIKQAVMEAKASKVLTAPPPIVNSFLGGFGRGMVYLSECRNVPEIPFPMPYLQTLMGMLMIHWVVTPLIAAAVMDSWWTGPILVFLTVASFWSLHFIANELDQPFGEEANDLPMREMQHDFNRSLLLLLDRHAETVPSFEINRAKVPAPRMVDCSSKVFGDKDHHNRFVQEEQPVAVNSDAAIDARV